MATSLDPIEARRAERRRRVLVGRLPPDFLTLGGEASAAPAGTEGLSQQQIQEQMDEQAALALHQQLNQRGHAAPPAVSIRGRLLISVMQAKLTKNYGMTRMDPYVRLHIGHHIYETPTDVNGAKNPKWNKTIQTFLPVGIQHVYLEIYDECNFSVDELIAHANITIPEQIFKGETCEEWYPLSGKQGEEKEGQIMLVFSFMNTPAGTQISFQGGAPLHGHHPPGTKGKHAQPVHVSGAPISAAVIPPQPQFSEEDFKTLKDMFPNMDEDVIRSVYEAGGFNKDSAANALLAMCCD